MEKKTVRYVYTRRLTAVCMFSLLICLLPPTLTAQAAELKLNQKKKVLLVGESYQLKTNGGKKITWKSSKPKVTGVSKNGKIVGKSAGTATITATSGKKSVSCKVTVKNTVDVIIFAGQSNMTGYGNASGAPALTDGAGYAYKPVTNKMKLETLKEPFGRGQDDSFFQNGDYSRGSMVTAFVNSYYKQTETPVIAVPASCVGTGSVSWAQSRYQGVIQRTNAAVKLAKKRHLSVRHVYLVWMQGENDAFACMSAQQHQKNLTTFFNKVKKATKIKTCMVITIPSYYNGPIQLFPSLDKELDLGFDIGKQYKIIQNAQKQLCKKNSNFVMISTTASSLNASYLQDDGIHLTQKALNMIGNEAGTNAGKIAKKK